MQSTEGCIVTDGETQHCKPSTVARDNQLHPTHTYAHTNRAPMNTISVCIWPSDSLRASETIGLPVVRNVSNIWLSEQNVHTSLCDWKFQCRRWLNATSKLQFLNVRAKIDSIFDKIASLLENHYWYWTWHSEIVLLSFGKRFELLRSKANNLLLWLHIKFTRTSQIVGQWAMTNQIYCIDSCK